MITSPDLAALPDIRHGYFTRQGGVSTGIYASLNIGIGSDDDRANVLENRRRVAERLGTTLDRLAMPYQVHSADVVTVTEPWTPGEGPRVDALVTDRPGIAIGVSTADCGPILFADSAARVVGAAHAGWKGAFTGVLEATIAAMEALGADRTRIVAVLGPSISQKAYEVGPEFVARFEAANPDNARYFIPSDRSDHAMFDLQTYSVDRLAAAGIGNAGSLGICTYGDEARFFSYRRTTHRREPDYGRLVSAIMLV
jgi:YfiH family protein